MGAAKARWPGLLLGLALAGYLAVVARNTVEWPYGDDFESTLRFLAVWAQGDGATRLRALVTPHNEHRLVFNHLVEALDLTLFGRIHLSHMVAVGTLAWLLCILLIWDGGRRAGLSMQERVPAILILSAFSHHELMTWAMGSLQQYGQLLWCLLALHAATRQRFALSCLAFVAAVFTGGGGFALAPCLVLHWALRRDAARTAATVALTLLLAWVWFAVLPPFEPHRTASLSAALAAPQRLVAYALCFIGSAGKSTQAAVAVGAAQLGLVAWLGWRSRVLGTHPFLSLTLLFVAVSAGLAALARMHLGLDQARSSRYTEYALVSLASLCMLHLAATDDAATRQRRWRVWMGLAALVWLLWAAHGSHQLADKRRLLERRDVVSAAPAEAVQQDLREALRLGVFRPDAP